MTNELTKTDKKDLEICKEILALYKQLSKKCQKNLHDCAGTWPWTMSTRTDCMENVWTQAVEYLEQGKTSAWWE